MIIEHSFRILKGMCKILKNPFTNCDLKRVPSLILACCLLHNNIIDKNDLIHELIILWRHLNLEYRHEVVKNISQSNSQPLQKAIARHSY